jgi:hypothetical protein
MEIIKVGRVHLLDTMRKNREAHAEEFALAEKGYWLKMEEGLAKALKEVRKHGEFVNKDLFRSIPYIPGSRPENHTHDYDVVIKMLEFSVDDVIELDRAKFQAYVMDNWQWSGTVKATNSFYAGAVLGAK